VGAIIPEATNVYGMHFLGNATAAAEMSASTGRETAQSLLDSVASSTADVYQWHVGKLLGHAVLAGADLASALSGAETHGGSAALHADATDGKDLIGTPHSF
jgi:hypothetical protein